MRYCVSIRLFPEAPVETREFVNMKEAQTFAFHKRALLHGQFYTITIHLPSRPEELEILIGKIYRGLHE